MFQILKHYYIQSKFKIKNSKINLKKSLRKKMHKDAGHVARERLWTKRGTTLIQRHAIGTNTVRKILTVYLLSLVALIHSCYGQTRQVLISSFD